jgi:hypothetical protein
MDRDYPLPVSCPHCDNDDAQLWPPEGHFKRYTCPECGEFIISGTLEVLIEKGSIAASSLRAKAVAG